MNGPGFSHEAMDVDQSMPSRATRIPKKPVAAHTVDFRQSRERQSQLKLGLKTFVDDARDMIKTSTMDLSASVIGRESKIKTNEVIKKIVILGTNWLEQEFASLEDSDRISKLQMKPDSARNITYEEWAKHLRSVNSLLANDGESLTSDRDNESLKWLVENVIAYAQDGITYSDERLREVGILQYRLLAARLRDYYGVEIKLNGEALDDRQGYVQ